MLNFFFALYYTFGTYIGWTTDQPIRYTRLSNIAMGVSERVQMVRSLDPVV